MEFFRNLFTQKTNKDPKEMMAATITLFNSTMQEMRDLPTNDPNPGIWAKVINELTKVIKSKTYNERALYLRARAYYHGGHYVEAVQDLDTFFKDGHQYDAIVHGDLAPKTLRGMAKVELDKYKEAEVDLKEEIGDLQKHLDIRSVRRSRAYYWFLVCKHNGDRSAANHEQAEYY